MRNGTRILSPFSLWELVHDGKVENVGEEGVAVVENANGCDAVRDDNKERDAGKERMMSKDSSAR